MKRRQPFRSFCLIRSLPQCLQQRIILIRRCPLKATQLRQFPQPSLRRPLRPNQPLRRKLFLRQHIPRKSRQPRRRQAIHRRAVVLRQAAAIVTAMEETAVATAVHRAVSPKLRFTAATPLCPTTITDDTAIRAATPSAKSSSTTAPKRFRLTTRCN